MFDSILKTAATAILATGIGAGVVASPASAASFIGTWDQDAAGQAVQLGGTTCTITAGDPVVVTENGVRYVRTSGTLSCSNWVNVGGIYGSLYSSGGVQTSRTVTGPYYNRNSLTLITQRPCNGASNRYWSGLTEFAVDLNRDGYVDAYVRDASLANLRSCGL